MARPRNEEKRELIIKNACQLFIEEGYEGASYSAIAKRSGLRKSAVQSCFPKKEQLAVAFFEHLEQYSEEYLEQNSLLSEDRFADLYLIGQLHFIFLTRNASARRFFFEVLGSRALTNSIVVFDNNFAMDYLQTGQAAERDKVFDDLVISMGGMYELLYYRIENSRSIDVADTSRTLVSAYATSLSTQLDEEMFERCRIDEDEYERINVFLMAKYYEEQAEG